MFWSNSVKSNLYKADHSIQRTLIYGPNGVRFREIPLYSKRSRAVWDFEYLEQSGRWIQLISADLDEKFDNKNCGVSWRQCSSGPRYALPQTVCTVSKKSLSQVSEEKGLLGGIWIFRFMPRGIHIFDLENQWYWWWLLFDYFVFIDSQLVKM